MRKELKKTTLITADAKFVFYADDKGNIKRAQMLNRDAWGYLDLQGRGEVGRITVAEFIKLHSTYCSSNWVWLHPEPAVQRD